MAKQSPALKITGLTKKYGELVALAPLDLEVKAGSRVSLIGANGSGKTTLLRLVAGLVEKSAGEVEVLGEEAGTLEARALLSYLPDEPVLYDDLSVREHLEYLSALYGLEDWSSRAEDLLVRLGIAGRADDIPSGFSRGLRQKTSLAIGFLRPFDVLLVDEPFVGLDEPGRIALLELLDEATERGATVIVASHQLELLRKADRCIALGEGKIVYDGKADSADLVRLVGG